MLTFCVLHPDALNKSNFDDLHYGKFARMFLRTLDSNNILLLDSNDCLLSKFEENIGELKIKDRQELEIRLVELKKMLQNKKVRRAIVRCSTDRCRTDQRQSLNRQCGIMSSNTLVDAVVCGSGSNDALRAEVKTVPVIELPDFSNSDIDQQRLSWMDQLPPIDGLAPGVFDNLIIRATCYSSWLRIYDKQIGKATNPSNFRRGIERILSLWISNCHFVPSTVEIITTEAERDNEHSSSFVNQRRAATISEKLATIKSRIIEPLQQEFPVTITLSVKQDPSNIYHARHLQSQTANLLFERGFDFLTNDGAFRCAVLKMDNGIQAHLQKYRALAESEFRRAGELP